ncbi:MAG TPA: PilZ domain-containing protein [Myxococcales bacterium]|nr:PilZ domain-containing protein [Myxococcales bacterium]
MVNETQAGLGSNRRTQYRVQDLEKYQICVELVVEDQTIPAEIVNLSFNGAGVRVLRSDGPYLAEQTRIFIRLLGPYLPEPIKAVAIVNFAAKEGDGYRYGLRFLNARHIQDQVPPKLMGVFNRRRAFRVIPESGHLVTAAVSGRGGELDADLPIISLSVSGIAVYIKDKSVLKLELGEIITLVFKLPEEMAPCRICGTVRYVREWQQGERYGVEFVDDQSRVFQRSQRQVMEYVMKQQRVMLRKRSDMG